MWIQWRFGLFTFLIHQKHNSYLMWGMAVELNSFWQQCFSKVLNYILGKGKFFYSALSFVVFIKVGPRNSNHRPENPCIMLKAIPVQRGTDSLRLRARSFLLPLSSSPSYFQIAGFWLSVMVFVAAMFGKWQ